MSNNYFEFRKFKIDQDRCAMKVGTDGVLLGAWADLKGAERILDAGSGTGLIALMCAQRSSAFIDAVEIDMNASEQAAANCMASPWKDRIAVHCRSFQKYAIETVFTYDVILSNPPFFRNSLKPPDKLRSLARHDDRLSYESLIHFSSSILSPSGRLAVVLPREQSEHFINVAWLNHLYLIRKSTVRPYPGKNGTRCLLEFAREKPAQIKTDEIIIRTGVRDGYTEQFKELTSEFYLNH